MYTIQRDHQNIYVWQMGKQILAIPEESWLVYKDEQGTLAAKAKNLSDQQLLEALAGAIDLKSQIAPIKLSISSAATAA